MELASEGSRFFLDELKVSSKAYVLSNEGFGLELGCAITGNGWVKTAVLGWADEQTLAVEEIVPK